MPRLIPMLTLLALLAPAPLAAQHAQTRDGFGISFGLGTGSAGASCDGCDSERESGFSGYLRLGGYVRPTLFVAGETNGWTSSADGIDQTVGFYSAVVQWYPNVERGPYLKGGLGFATKGELEFNGIRSDIEASADLFQFGLGFTWH